MQLQISERGMKYKNFIRKFCHPYVNQLANTEENKGISFLFLSLAVRHSILQSGQQGTKEQ